MRIEGSAKRGPDAELIRRSGSTNARKSARILKRNRVKTIGAIATESKMFCEKICKITVSNKNK